MVEGKFYSNSGSGTFTASTNTYSSNYRLKAKEIKEI